MAEFLESLEKFSHSLLGAKDNMNSHLVLTDTEYAAQLDSMRTAADYRTASQWNNLVNSYIYSLFHTVQTKRTRSSAVTEIPHDALYIYYKIICKVHTIKNKNI